MSHYAGMTFEEAQEREKKEYCFTSTRSGWVSVDDRLPAKMTPVLIYTGTFMDIGAYCGDNHFITERGSVLDTTHWMPLPSPPELADDKLSLMEAMNYKPEY